MTNHFTRRYFEAFPFTNFTPLQDSSHILYMREVNCTKTLCVFDSTRHDNLDNGDEIIGLDFNKQAYYFVRKVGPKIYFLSDNDNKENFNIFSVDIESKKIQQMTFNDYTACVLITDDELAYYSSRKMESNGKFLNEIHVYDLKSGQDKIIVNDDGDIYRLGWGRVIPSRDKKSIFLHVDKDNNRTNLNLCLVDVETKRKQIILPAEFESSYVFLVEKEIDTDLGFYFMSDCLGYANLYYFNFSTFEVLQLTETEFMTDGFEDFYSNGKRYFYQNKVSPETGKTSLMTYIEDYPGKITKIDDELVFDGEIIVLSRYKDFLWVGQSNFSQPNNYRCFRLDGLRWKEELVIPFYRQQGKPIVHSIYEFTKYKSFDGLAIPSYVLIPNGDIKGAVITAFYGGRNYYSYHYQILAELGFVVLSPAVRGSWGHGKKWENMLKGDLGGNEILDLIWGARFLEEKFGLSPSKIGLEGGSHGGYSTLRALTMPPDFKEVDSKYPFGFGICWAGFADLINFYQTSNIPDWLSNMLGPYEGNEVLYHERSPVNHFEQLSAPLFITHGTSDSRVPPSTMDGFLEKLGKSKVPHHIYMMDGQGHTGGSINERVDEYRTMFEFLEKFTNLGWNNSKI